MTYRYIKQSQTLRPEACSQWRENMFSNWHDESKEHPFLIKAMVLAVVAVFAVIGLIGLVLPIIPGIVFLALAALLLSRVSRRFAAFLHDQPMWQKLTRLWRSQSFLTATERIKLTGLYCVRGLVAGMDSLAQSLRRKAQ
jgi:uncharacterized membrane protein YbaN (DUF454 family)